MRLKIFLFFIIAVSASTFALLEDMSRQERWVVFGEIDNVPQYEIVSIELLQDKVKNTLNNNSRTTFRLNAFGKDIKLWLQDSNEILLGDKTPIYSVYNATNDDSQFREHTDAVKRILPVLYHNYEYATTLAVIADRNGRKRMAGVISSENLVIRPLPERIVDKVTKRRRSTDANTDSSDKDRHNYHIVYKSAEKNTSQSSSQESDRINDQFIPSVIYPEILVIVDHSLYKLFNKNLSDVLLYLLAFWNGVDMKFRTLEKPRFRLNIAAIVLAEDDNALEYISSSKINGIIEFNLALDGSKYWLHNRKSTINVNKYDVAVTMTSSIMCDISLIRTYFDMNICTNPTLGVAYKSGACQLPDKNTINKTIIVHDAGGFGAIYTAAHELAHSFGAQHDNFHNPKCSERYGFIMASTSTHTSNGSDWSACTLNDFQKSLSSSNLTCLYNRPNPGSNYGGFLPGRLMDANEQCRQLEKTKAAKIDETICVELKCLKYNRLSRVVGKPGAVDGTACGDGKFCLHNRCISEVDISI